MMIKWMICALCVVTAALSAEVKVLALAGSLRQDSVNKKLVTEASRIARQEGATVTLVDLKDFPIPFYDGDLEDREGMPEKAKQLQKLMLENSVVLVASPEYNGSLSGVLKNTLDWLSRAESDDPFEGRKFVIMSASPGRSGGARGLGHLRTILENVGATVIPGQVTIPCAYEAFDDQGHLKSSQQEIELVKLVQSALKA